MGPDARAVSRAHTGPGWTLLDAGGFPGLVRSADAPGVRGDIVEISADRLGTLDDYEGVAEGIYVRETMDFFCQPDGRVVKAQAYVFVVKPEHASLPVAGGEWPVG